MSLKKERFQPNMYQVIGIDGNIQRLDLVTNGSFQSNRFVLAGLYPIESTFFIVIIWHFGTTNKATAHSLPAAIINAVATLSITKVAIRKLLRVAKKLPEHKSLEAMTHVCRSCDTFLSKQLV